MTLFQRVVDTSGAVASTSKRSAKTAVVAALLADVAVPGTDDEQVVRNHRTVRIEGAATRGDAVYGLELAPGIEAPEHLARRRVQSAQVTVH